MKSMWPSLVAPLLFGTIAGTAEAQSIITVDTTADVVLRNGLCSLREAIIASNLNQSGDTLSAECSGSGVNDSIRFRAGANPVITLGSALPVITEQVNILGPAARVVINGLSSGVGIDIGSTAPGTVVSRLVVQDFTVGIRVQGANAVIAGNYIGTDAAGTSTVPNATGILVTADGVRIGGTTGVTTGGACTGDCNLVAGANVDGIHLDGAQNTLIQGNMIGTNASGTAALGNAGGIRLTTDATAIIGGTTAAASNLISGNGAGITFEVSLGSAGSSILGNRIGTNAGGTAAVPNGVGIHVSPLFDPAYPVAIGGAAPGAGNVISGNTSVGIRLNGADGVRIEGNRVGTRADGTTPLGNVGIGIEIINSAQFNVIGGDDAAEANVIAGNAAGVRIANNSFGNTILRNSIYDNVGEGIQLDDAQAGTAPQPPSIAGLNPVTGLGCPSCWIDLYSDTANEGRTWHAQVVTDGAGNFSFGGAVDGPYVTATATPFNGSTSEFSDPFLEDSDGDARADRDDNCTHVVNVDQRDVDADGYGNICDADLNNSNLVTSVDFNELRSVLNQTCPVPANTSACRADMNGTGLVNVLDYNLLRASLNQPPGPSGLACAGTPPCP